MKNPMTMRIDVQRLNLNLVKYVGVPETLCHTNLSVWAGIEAYRLDHIHSRDHIVYPVEYVSLGRPWYTSQGDDAHSG